MQQNLPKTSAWRVTSSPHLRARHSVSSIMLDVIIALIPAGIAGVIIFGWRAAALIVISVASAVMWEGLIQKAMEAAGDHRGSERGGDRTFIGL